MLEYRINVNRSQRLVYIPKKILEALGHDLTLLPDATAAILYPTGENPEIIARSVEILLQDLNLRAKMKVQA